MKNNTQRMIDYCPSTVNIATVIYQFYYYLYYIEIEQKKVHDVLLSIYPKILSYFRYVLY